MKLDGEGLGGLGRCSQANVFDHGEKVPNFFLDFGKSTISAVHYCVVDCWQTSAAPVLETDRINVGYQLRVLPQCIWIERALDPKTQRPIQEPSQFIIDVDICMNCGLCAEFCPFDSIKMDHDYEIASYGRTVHHLDDLLKPASYYDEIRPVNSTREAAARKEAEEAKAAKKAAREAKAAARAAAKTD